MKTITGFNENTAQNLMVDAGAVFVNFDIEKDTLETAKDKLIGATSGGNEFKAEPEFRDIQIDGVKGKVKGLNLLESWEVTFKTNLLEFKKETFAYALAGAETEEVQVNEHKYTKISGKNQVTVCDYIDNITYVGNISGSDNPVIIQIYNCLNTEGLTVTPKDGDDIVAELTFEGHYSADKLDNPPFAIYYPDFEPSAPVCPNGEVEK